MKTRLFRYGLLAVLLALIPAAGVQAQDSAAPPSEEHPSNGIAVHGHWTVTVVRDGVVVDRREFENALTGGGQVHLSNLLGREVTAGPWFVLVEADGTGTLCANNEYVLGDDTDCTISEVEGELTASATANNTVLLEGTETVQRDGNLTIVNSYQRWCSPTIAAADCSPGATNRAQITRRTLDTPIPVLNGDEIQVTVELSFS